MSKVFILIDNKVHQPGLSSEHGLSMALRLDDNSLFLWDTGASRKFMDNADKMQLDISAPKGLALSHGHYDHTSGLAAFISEKGYKGPIYGHPDLARPRYCIEETKETRFIGLDTKSLAWPPESFIPVKDTLEVLPGLFMLTAIPRLAGHCDSCKGFYFDANRDNPDPVADDAFLVLLTQKGPAVILGCCHSGLANTLTHVRISLGFDALYAVVGGMHLYDASAEAVRQAIHALESFKVQRIYPGHCTGDGAMRLLNERFADRMEPMGSGMIIDMP